MNRDLILTAISQEVDRAYKKHGREQWGRHEFYAVILEEFQEVMEAFRFRFLLSRRIKKLWHLVRRDAAQEELKKEITQVAAMCVRYLETGDRYRERSSGNTISTKYEPPPFDLIA